MKKVVIYLAALTYSCGTDSAAKDHRQSKFPWMENLVRLPFPEEDNSTEVSAILAKYPAALRPFINTTAMRKSQRNNTRDYIITDDDVADIIDDDESHKMNTAHYDGKKMTVTISTEAGVELYQHWLDQAVSGLMAAVATKKLEDVPDYVRTAHQSCAKEAKTVQAHAKCVVALLDAELKYQKWSAKFGSPIRLNKMMRRRGSKVKTSKRRNEKLEKETSSRTHDFRRFGKKSTEKMSSSFKTSFERLESFPYEQMRGLQPKEYISSDGGWVGSFRLRAKRSIEEQKENPKRMQVKPVQKSNYNLMQEPRTSPLALLARKLVRTVRTFKNKDKDYKNWKDVIGEIKELGKKLKQKQRVKKMLEQRFDLFKSTLRDQGMDKALVKRMDVLGDDTEDEEMETMMLKAKKQEQTMSPEDKMMQVPVKLIREGLKLGMMMSGHNVSNYDRANIKLISPRLLSLVPEDSNDETVNLLSPSLFSLHNDGHGMENELSLAKALKLFDEQGHEDWLNFVIEASGVSDAVIKMKDVNEAEEKRQLYERYRGKDDQPLYFTKENVTEMYGPQEAKKIDIFEKLQKSLSHEQMLQMNSTGYTVMNSKQLDLVYGFHSPFYNPSAHKRLNNVSTSEVPPAIESTIRGLAKETIKFEAQMRKDIVLTPLVLTTVISDPALVSQGLILSPVFMVPVIYSPAVFGSVILSPWAFVPVIISPRVLSPVVLSPILLSPVILSPLALDPLILSPGALVPFVLSPFVLSPFVLSPVALAPLILSPFCLSPFILIPNVLSPLILSPFVLSPLILSPVAFSAFVLTPYVLSPILGSPGTFFSAVLSPTWLS